MLTRSIIVILIGTGAIVVASVLSCAVFVKPESVVPVQPMVENIVNNDVVSPATIPTTTSTSLPFVEDDDIPELDTSDWKVYRNEEYGFEIRYPKNWELVNLGDFYVGNTGVVLKSPNYKPIKDGNVIHKGEIYIHGIENKNDLSIEDLFDTFNDTSRFWFDKFKHKDIIINGNFGVIFDYIQEDSHPSIHQSNIKSINAYIKGDKKVIGISYLFLENPKREIFNKILYSFNFTE